MEQDLQSFATYYPLFITFLGYVVGLGAVTVIDLHGLLGQKSHYWTEATIRTHKVTKPLIWIGTGLVSAGVLLSDNFLWSWEYYYIQLILILLLIVNGCFLSFVVSPYLISQEKRGKSDQLLPDELQMKIRISFMVSVLGWWGSLLLFFLYCIRHLAL